MDSDDLRRQMKKPWPERFYTISRTNTRQRALMRRGLPPVYQYTVRIPAEIAEALWREGATFHWRVSGDDLLLERTPYLQERIPTKWTPEMDERVLNIPEGMTHAEFGAEIGVSGNAISARRYYLKSAIDYGVGDNSRWTAEMDEMIMAKGESDVAIARLLGISSSAVKGRRQRLREMRRPETSGGESNAA